MRKVFAGLLVVFFFPGASAKSQTAEPFSMVAFELSEGRMWNVLRGIRSEIRARLPRQERCLAGLAHCNAAERLLRDVVTEAAANGGRARIETVNVRINAAIRYRSDEKRWNVADAWAAAVRAQSGELLGHGTGRLRGLFDGQIRNASSRRGY